MIASKDGAVAICTQQSGSVAYTGQQRNDLLVLRADRIVARHPLQ
jgi:hypothetical protein